MLKRNPGWRQAALQAPPRGTTFPVYAEDFSLLVKSAKRVRKFRRVIESQRENGRVRGTVVRNGADVNH